MAIMCLVTEVLRWSWVASEAMLVIDKTLRTPKWKKKSRGKGPGCGIGM
jgi:hypothetical protein